MPASTKPVQTSASELKDLLAKTGRSLKKDDRLDKLDVLGFLVEQINDKLNRGFKMKLSLADLNIFLSREGMAEELDFKGCIGKIIQFVYGQRERLGQHVQPREGEKRNTDLLDSLLKLWAMEDKYVNECFAIEVYSPPVSNGQKNADAKVESGVSPKTSMEIVAKPESAAETTDDKVQDSSIELVLKRRRTDDHPVGASLFADLKRLVPLDLLAIEDTTQQDASEASFAERRRIAHAEVDRILKADSEGSSVLLGNSANERLGSFRTIVRFLHPEVGLISEEDVRAIRALDLSLKAFVKSELSAGDQAH